MNKYSGTTTTIFESYELFFKYLFKLYQQTVDDKDPPWMSRWDRNCVIK